MRERAGTAGGTISFKHEAGFQIVCVLPREEKMANMSGS
jgi:signal transduction histidine kinase